MESRLAALLTVLSVAITALVVAGFSISAAYALAVAAISAAALLAWLATGSNPPDQETVVTPYLLTLVMVLVVGTSRYLGGVVPWLAGPLRAAFVPGFPVTDATWFTVFVVAPISLMLLGGHYLVRRLPLGLYLAWWTALYAAADGLLQLVVVGAATAPPSLAAAGSLLLALVEVCCAMFTVQALLRRPGSGRPEAATPSLTLRQRNLWTLLFASAVSVYAVALFESAGLVPLLIVVGSMAGGLVGWRFTTALRPADPARAVPLYLLLLALFYVHVGEEALTHFNRGIALLSGKPWNDHDFMLLIGLAGPIVFFFSAWSLWKRQPLGNFIFWFFIVGMILGEPTHLLLFPVAAMHRLGVGYQYFSGMVTALFPMIPAILALVMIVGEHRRAREQGIA